MEANKISIIGGRIVFKNNNNQVSFITSDIDSNIKFSGGRLTNVAQPINDDDVVTKEYLNNLIPLDLNLIDIHLEDDTNPHNVTKEQIGLGLLKNIKSIYDAGFPPNTNHNLSLGFDIGSRWLDIVNKKEYICVQSSSISAIWVETTAIDLQDTMNSMHCDIDNHIENDSIHRKLDDSLISNSTLWSSAKVVQSINSSMGGNHVHNFDQIEDGLGNSLDTKLMEIDVDLHNLKTGSNPHDITKETIGLGNIENIKNIITTTTPTSSDDASKGYSIGSKWINTILEKEYVCFDSTLNSAKWKTTTIKNTSDLIEGNNLFYTQNRVTNHPLVLQNTQHRSLTNNPHSITKDQIGLGDLINYKSNFSATISPTGNDDSAHGYSIGSRWYDVTNKKEYVCFDNSLDSAIWKETTIDSAELTGEAMNVGDSGVGIYKDKELTMLKFKRLAAGSARIVVVDDTMHDTVDIDVMESNLNLNNIGGILSVAKGGTGLNSIPHNRFLVGNGTDPLIIGKLTPNGAVVGTVDAQILTNKSIDVSLNSIINISDSNIKDNANVNITKLANGSVSNTEFQYLSGTKSNIQTQIDIHSTNMNNPHHVTKEQLGLNNIQNTKVNYSALFKPTVLNDIVGGYAVGSRWINKTTGKEYVCTDNTEANAIWTETTQPFGEVNAGNNLGTGQSIYKDKSNEKLNFKSIKEGKYTMIDTVDNDIIVNASNSHSFILAIVPVEAITTYYKTVTIIPWLNSSFSSYSSGKIIFEVEIFNLGLDIKAYDSTNNADLGFHTTIVHSGHYSFDIANPGSDARVEIQIKKNIPNISPTSPLDPQIHGIILTYTS